MKKIHWVLLIILFFILTGGKIYTDMLVNKAETHYPPSNFVEVENTRLHYVEEGIGQPVIFIPGGSGKVQDFSLSPLYNLVTDQYNVIIFDRPGLGYSGKPGNEVMTPKVQARLIHAALITLGYEKPVIVGQSWGGLIALAYAQEYPDELSGIVLIGSSPYPRERHTSFFNVIARTPFIGDLIAHTLYVPIGYHWLAPAIMTQNADLFEPLKEVPESYYDSTLEIGLRPSHVITAAKETGIIPAALPALVEGLHRVTVPVMILAGDQDEHAYNQSSQLGQDLPNSRTRIIEGADHYLWFSKPEIILESIDELYEWVDSTENSE